jgi:hypothetical protein
MAFRATETHEAKGGSAQKRGLGFARFFAVEFLSNARRRHVFCFFSAPEKKVHRSHVPVSQNQPPHTNTISEKQLGAPGRIDQPPG